MNQLRCADENRLPRRSQEGNGGGAMSKLNEIKQKSKQEAVDILVGENEFRFKQLYDFRLSINKVELKNLKKYAKDKK